MSEHTESPRLLCVDINGRISCWYRGGENVRGDIGGIVGLIVVIILVIILLRILGLF